MYIYICLYMRECVRVRERERERERERGREDRIPLRGEVGRALCLRSGASKRTRVSTEVLDGSRESSFLSVMFGERHVLHAGSRTRDSISRMSKRTETSSLLRPGFGSMKCSI